MNRELSMRRIFLKVLIFTLVAPLIITATPSAQIIDSPEDLMRDDMMLIADRYATHVWTARQENIRHSDRIHTPDAVTDYTDTILHPPPPVDNDGNVLWWLDQRHGGWWETENVNVGVPYYWVGATAIGDSDLSLYRDIENGGYFDEKLLAGYPAGDVTTEVEPVTLPDGRLIYDQKVAYGTENGVDCVGLINNVWRLGKRAGTSATNNQTRAIKFENLKRGDILMKFGAELDSNGSSARHVMLFAETIYEPSVTKVRVYESSASYGRVTESIWKVLSIDPYEDPLYGGSPSHKLKMERVQVKLDGVWVEADPYIQDGYVPRTVFQPRDIVIVIDSSGSMGQENRMGQAKEAAKLFIDTMRPGDRIGVVSFATGASQVYPPMDEDLVYGEIDSLETVKTDAKNAVANISAIGGTSIGSGLGLGLQLLNTSNGENRTQLIILLSDGENTNYPDWDEIGEITVPVYTVSVGSDNYQTLLDIANATGGLRFSADSGYWVNLMAQVISVETYRENIIEEVRSQVLSGSTVAQAVFVDSSVGSATFSLAWPGSDLDLTLVQPDGTVIDPTVAEVDPNIDFVSGATYEFYKITYPQKGQWTVRVFGKDTSGPEEDYSMVVSASDAMILSVDTDRDEYIINNPVKITASIEDSILDTPLAPEYIHGVTMQVTVNGPNNTVYSYELYDDGLHDDGEADDGVYANAFNDTSLIGSYDFNVHISGNTNRDGQAFTREKNLTVLVVYPPTVVSSNRVFGSPTNYFEVDYKVTFSEPVTGVDVSDFALTTSGVSGAVISSVSGSGDVYTVTVNTGSGNGTIRLDVVDDDSIIDADRSKLAGTGTGNGNFTGEVYDIDKTIISTVVTKIEDTDDGLCDSDCSLREAISAALSNYTITFDTPLSGGVSYLTSPLTLSRNIAIDGSMLTVPVTLSGDSNNDGTGDVEIFIVDPGINATLNSLTISDGQNNTNEGGGIHSQGVLTVINSAFLNNNSSASGGGITNRGGTLTVVNSTFSGNSAAYGGGIFSQGPLSITNSTFYDNYAVEIGGGIAFSLETLTITNSTLSGNSASSGGGIYIYATNPPSALNYANTIIANSLSGGDCYGGTIAIVGNDNNLVEDGSCSALLSGDPNLGALADNGGITQTMELLEGSPAIDAGDDAICSAAPVNNLDQRGVIRPQGSHCDIGAYEYGQVTNSAPIVDAGNDQMVNLSAGVSIAATYYDADIADNHSATVDWGDGTVDDVPVNMTGPGTGEVIGEHSYTSPDEYTVEVCIIDLYGAVGCDSILVTVNSGFPSTSILDDFNRADGGIGSNWGGEVSSFAIVSNHLRVDDYGSIFWKGEPFGADQEAFVTLTTVDGQAPEHDLLLKSQSSFTYGYGVLEVSYDAISQRVQVWTWDWPQDWVQHGADIPVTFEDGDQFGARAFADGTVEVYRNGELLGTRDISSWPHYADGGYIGLWFIGAEDSVSDDFGGGTIPTDPVTALPIVDDFNRANGPIGGNWSGATYQYNISSNQMQVGSASYGSEIYWNPSSFDPDQEAHFTFSQINTSATAQGLVLKAQNPGGWGGDGLLEVLYVAPLKSVQIWTYAPSQGWVQRGDGIPVIFSNGDQFSARAYANGALEVYKNGILFARRDITVWPYYASGGYIGMGFVNANSAKVDDFGGGTLSVGQGMMGMPEGLSQSSTLGGGFELEIASDSFDVTLDSPSRFWQGVPLGSEQEAVVTFAQVNKTALRQRPLSNGEWGQDVVQVFYDVVNRRIQVWMYDPQMGWVQYGKDIRVNFASGDKFAVSMLANGTLEIQRNGKPLASRDVTP